MLYKVVKCFEGMKPGTVIELNDRRAKSEMPRGRIVLYKEEKRKVKTKEEKATKKTK